MTFSSDFGSTYEWMIDNDPIYDAISSPEEYNVWILLALWLDLRPHKQFGGALYVPSTAPARTTVS